MDDNHINILKLVDNRMSVRLFSVSSGAAGMGKFSGMVPQDF